MVSYEHPSEESRSARHEFIARHQDKITGTLSAFDRLVFRGTLRSIAHEERMKRCLGANPVLRKDFGAHVDRVSRRLKGASLAEAQALGRVVLMASAYPYRAVFARARRALRG